MVQQQPAAQRRLEPWHHSLKSASFTLPAHAPQKHAAHKHCTLLGSGHGQVPIRDAASFLELVSFLPPVLCKGYKEKKLCFATQEQSTLLGNVHQGSRHVVVGEMCTY
eukprot:1161309-Pelagomonas_calceolata.AAC.9